MKKNNIIFFTGENSIFLKKELDNWVRIFDEKYGEFNISKINRDSLDKINIESELTTPPFLSEKRLILLNDLPFPGGKEKLDNLQESESTKESKEDEKIMNLLNKIPESNFVIFVQEKPDKRKGLYKKLLEIGTIKEFKNLDERELAKYIRERLLLIDSGAIEKLIEYKNADLAKIDLEIDKLGLFRNHERISTEDIKKFVSPEIETSIFKFLDRLFELNFDKAIQSLNEILDGAKIEIVFAGIMTNIRKYLFTLFLHRANTLDSVIIENLKLHPFVFQKTINQSKNYGVILSLYNSLSEIDVKSKIGGLMGDNEGALKLALEKVILDLKKNKKYLQ